MSEQISELMAEVGREQDVLLEMIRANLEADVEQDAAGMAERHRDMIPVMKRLGEATHRLILTSAVKEIPADLAAQIETWRQEISSLLTAIQARATNFETQREKIREALQRLGKATQGFAGYQAPKARGPHYVEKKA